MGAMGMESRNFCSLEEKSWVLWNRHRDLGENFLSQRYPERAFNSKAKNLRVFCAVGPSSPGVGIIPSCVIWLT